ncbi:MAG TPA: peptidoglycan-binding protein [Candidatus Limnocylindria bacterium]|nr:peptidoglycan-binding protein [Candidatus Limnocylindria bacterium]
MKRFSALALAVLLAVLFTVGASADSLRYGDEGSQVRLAQARLSQLGYYKDALDGKFGYSTFVAVKAFQAKNGLVADGAIGQLTVAKLYGDVVTTASGATINSPFAIRVDYGDHGPAVDLIQLRLKALNYYGGAVDGKFGYGTVQAVRAFQKKNSLTVDGIVGRKTWLKLFSAGAIANDGSPDPTPDPGTDTYFRITYGMAGPLVLQIQTKLKALNYSVGALDSKYGYQTVLAVRDFQKVNGLKVDGVVGRNTWDKLFGPAPLPKP